MKIVATSQYRLKSLTVRQDILVFVQRGEKRLISPQITHRCHAAQILLMAKGTQWEVINDPAHALRYEAQVVTFSNEALQCAAKMLSLPALHQVHSAQLMNVDSELQEAISRLEPDRFAGKSNKLLQEHRTVELLLLLAERGYFFVPWQHASWMDRTRHLVAQRPDQPWTVGCIADAFHTSASSLRRRLLEEGVTVAALVKEVRLEVALAMLQSDDHAIGQVAQHCGWDSHSRFSAAFKERWGVLPSTVKAKLKGNGQSLAQKG